MIMKHAYRYTCICLWLCDIQNDANRIELNHFERDRKVLRGFLHGCSTLVFHGSIFRQYTYSSMGQLLYRIKCFWYIHHWNVLYIYMLVCRRAYNEFRNDIHVAFWNTEVVHDTTKFPVYLLRQWRIQISAAETLYYACFVMFSPFNCVVYVPFAFKQWH